jgi:hypothetical protein
MQHSHPINDIVFKNISDGFAWGRYGNLNVIVDTTTGHINASHLCDLASADSNTKKTYAEWECREQSQEFIEAVTEDLNMSRDEIIISRTDLPGHLRGTYVHSLLIPYILMWASVKFYVYASKVIDQHVM